MKIWNLLGCPINGNILFFSRSATVRDLTSSGKAGGTLGIKGEILLPMARNAIVALTLAYASDTGRTWRVYHPKGRGMEPVAGPSTPSRWTRAS